MENLYLYGWKNYISNTNHSELESSKNKIGRVISIKGNIHEVVTETGVLKAELPGKLLYACEKWEQPKVGDWVKYLDYGDSVFNSGYFIPWIILPPDRLTSPANLKALMGVLLLLHQTHLYPLGESYLSIKTGFLRRRYILC